MRILLFSDIHSDEYALESLQRVYMTSQFDYVFVAGDITKLRGSISFVDDLLKVFPTCFAIPGNCDEQYVFQQLELGGNSVHGKRVNLKYGFNLVGFGFSPPTPFHTPSEMREEEIEMQMSKLPIDDKTLLLTHAPPYGVFDEIRSHHIGSSTIRKIIEEKKPFANFCGHVHENSGTDKVGNSHVVKIPAANSWKYVIANIKDKKLTVEFSQL